MNCKDLNITLCPICDGSILNADCWIPHFKRVATSNFEHLKTLFLFVAKHNENRSHYWLYHSVKLYKPERADMLERLLILL